MKCTSKKRLLCLVGIAAIFISSCGTQTTSLNQAFHTYETAAQYGVSLSTNATTKEFFSESLCVVDNTNFGTEKTNSQVAGGAGLFNLATNTVCYSQNIYDKLYPASTTKILTAYLAIKYGNLDDYATVSEYAVQQASDSSVCNLKAGDIIQLRDLVYGLMLRSGNDAAIVIAEHISGSVDAFAELMNKEAALMGASCSHFVNPNGLPDSNHYTSVYDLYLIFQNCLKDPTFLDVIQTSSYTAAYTDKNGNLVEQTWENTNAYLQGRATAPDGFTVVGGKTGTTGEAGYCLLLYSYNAKNEPIISIVLKADGRSNLYLLMNEMLYYYGNL